MSLRCIIVEDEPLAVERLTEYIDRMPGLALVGTFDNALDALGFVGSTEVNLAFLDVTLGGMSGIELLETGSFDCEVILTTAHQDFALRAYDLKVVDYLLKPFDFPRFVQAVERVQAGKSSGRDPGGDRGFVFVRTEFRLERIALGELLYIEGKGDYRQIHTVGKRIMTLQTFGELERLFPANRVCRVHKSFMVALDKIDSIERDRISIRNQLIPISATYRDQLYRLIDQRQG